MNTPDPTSSEKLRAAQRASERARASSSLPPTSGVEARPPRVLIVEDEVALGRALLRWLREYDVSHETGMAPALERIRAGERFDAILCDIMMPGGNGDQLFAAIQREAPELADRILFMTGGATTKSTIEFVSQQGERLLTKPIELKELRRRVALLLDKVRSASAKR
jgi:DNA-binding response OmpR family regulator